MTEIKIKDSQRNDYQITNCTMQEFLKILINPSFLGLKGGDVNITVDLLFKIKKLSRNCYCLGEVGT